MGIKQQTFWGLHNLYKMMQVLAAEEKRFMHWSHHWIKDVQTTQFYLNQGPIMKYRSYWQFVEEYKATIFLGRPDQVDL